MVHVTLHRPETGNKVVTLGFVVLSKLDVSDSFCAQVMDEPVNNPDNCTLDGLYGWLESLKDTPHRVVKFTNSDHVSDKFICATRYKQYLQQAREVLSDDKPFMIITADNEDPLKAAVDLLRKKIGNLVSSRYKYRVAAVKYDAVDEFAPDDAVDEFAPDDAVDEFASDDAVDEFAPDDAVDEFAPDDAVDEFASDDAVDEFAPDDAVDEFAPDDAVDESDYIEFVKHVDKNGNDLEKVELVEQVVDDETHKRRRLKHEGDMNFDGYKSGIQPPKSCILTFDHVCVNYLPSTRWLLYKQGGDAMQVRVDDDNVHGTLKTARVPLPASVSPDGTTLTIRVDQKYVMLQIVT